AAAVVAIRSSRTHTPERTCQEGGLHGAVPVALIEGGSNIVAFEIREDVSHHEGTPQWQLQWRLSAAIVFDVVERAGGGKHAVEDAVRRIIGGFDIRDAAIVVDVQIDAVAGGTTDLVECDAAPVGHRVLNVMCRLEVVEQIELQVVNNGWIDLVSVLRVGRGRGFDLVLGAVQHHARGSDHSSASAGSEQI